MNNNKQINITQLQQMKQKNNAAILTQLITSISHNKSKQHILHQLSQVDQKLSELYGRNNMEKSAMLSQLNSTAFTFNNTTKQLIGSALSLGIPKNNSLTDSLLRTTLGCQEKLAKSYLEIIDTSEQLQQTSKKQRIQQAKQRFASSNKFKDFYANSRPTLHDTYNYTYNQYHNFESRIQPVIDNQHQSYMKTQLIYLDKPKSGRKVAQKQYYDKHADHITKKIKEMGGMEDTVGSMEQSLGKYQLRNSKKRAVYAGWTGNNFTNTNNPYKNQSAVKQSSNESGKSWTDRSKIIRQTLMTKLDIQQ